MQEEFTDEDVDLMIALEQYEANIGPYGIPLDEAMSDSADPLGDGTLRFVPRPAINWAVKAVEDHAAQQAKEHPTENAHGRVYSIDTKRFRAPGSD
jgi:hypothetical protein